MANALKHIFYISEGKMYCTDGGYAREVPSGVLYNYTERAKDRARHNEWKSSGSGAVFMGAERSANVEESVEQIRSNSKIKCLGFCDGVFYYSLWINDVSGIYTKKTFRDLSEGVFMSDNEYKYGDFDFSANGDVAVVADFVGEAHLGIKRNESADFHIVTDGASIEASPSWSKTEKDVIYFAEAGLVNAPYEHDSSSEDVMLDASMLRRREMSPWSVSKLDMKNCEVVRVLTDDNYSYVKPQCTTDGALYYIKIPYKTDNKKTLGCLGDILLAPVRLIGALVGFFNIFTIKYSGKTLTTGNTKSKQMDERKMIIDGNIISAQKELRENEAAGDKFPGIIPRSWELHRLNPDGTDDLVDRSVMAYRVTDDGVLVSNGSYIVHIDENGNKEKIVKAENVSYILEC